MRGREAFAKLVLRARVAARRDEVRAVKNKCFGRRELTTLFFCTGCWGLAKTPPRPLRGALQKVAGRGTFRGTARGRNKCFGRRELTTLFFCTGCWGLAKTPPRPLRGAAPGSGGTRKIPRNRAGKRRGAPGARTMYAPAGAPVGGRCGSFRVAGRGQMNSEGPN